MSEVVLLELEAHGIIGSLRDIFDQIVEIIEFFHIGGGLRSLAALLLLHFKSSQNGLKLLFGGLD